MTFGVVTNVFILGSQIKEVEDKLGSKIKEVKDELGEVKDELGSRIREGGQG